MPVAISELTHQSSSGTSSGTQLNDIGKLISSQSIGEIDVCMNKLSNSEKYSLLFNYAKPCSRALPSWLNNVDAIGVDAIGNLM